MQAIFEKIWQLALPYLDTRSNDIHTEICREMANKLLNKLEGDRDIVIPAITLHDVGYKTIPEELQKKAFGKVVRSPELQRTHEIEGAKIAGEILESLDYEADKISEITQIIDGHDSREDAISDNDKIVKDADKLFRYSKKGSQIMFKISLEEFGESPLERLKRLSSIIDTMFFTSEAKEIAEEEIKARFAELESGEIG